MRDHTMNAFSAGLLTGALLTIGVACSAPEANADGGFDPDAASIAVAYAFGDVICQHLTNHPTMSGIEALGEGLMDEGLTARQAAHAIIIAADTQCPEKIPLLRAYANGEVGVA